MLFLCQLRVYLLLGIITKIIFCFTENQTIACCCSLSPKFKDAINTLNGSSIQAYNVIIKIFSHRWLYGANSYILSAKHQTDHDAFYQTYTWTKLSISIIWSQSYLRIISHVCFVNCLTMDIYWLLLLYECHKLYQLQEMDYNGVINKNIGLVIMK